MAQHFNSCSVLPSSKIPGHSHPQISPTVSATDPEAELENDDGCRSAPSMALSENLVEHVQSGCVHLVNHALQQRWEGGCYGCEINHPSQKHHLCLWLMPGCYQNNFDKVVKMLWN